MDVQQEVGCMYSEQQLKISFNEAFMHVYGNLSLEDGKVIEIVSFLTSLISNFNLYSRFTPDELPGLRNVIFQNEIVRDFVLTFQSVFFGRWVQGRGVDVVSALAVDLARSISTDADLISKIREEVDDTKIEQMKADYTFIPIDTAGSLISFEDAKRVLHFNPWLICVLLFQQYLNIDILEKITQITKDKKKPVPN